MIFITINTKCACEMVKNEYTILSHLDLICEKNFHLKKGNGLDKARPNPWLSESGMDWFLFYYRLS